ncbi:MAG TPA: hypothetical protein VFQ16_01545 [Burkholderiaceae bacterium]|nr:hypothetical protein [Burkholderiaceae bacterium]
MQPTLSRPAMIPRRTTAGQVELERRGLGLSQRHRTVLLLVDGRRELREILELARQAGADRRCFDELLAHGLVAGPVGEPEGLPSSVLPSSLSLHGDSTWSSLEHDEHPPSDRPFEEARALLVRAVRSEAPLAGALTLIKLRRAATREDLECLLDEVEQRLRKPHRKIIAAQTLRHVRHLLSLPSPSRPAAG